MEEFLKDKIFQFYYKKIYGQKSNYQSFISFNDKDKVSFLINLYLFISNINNNKKNNAPINQKDINEINYVINNDDDFFYNENYNKIMNEYSNILNKYNHKFNENMKENNENKKKNNERKYGRNNINNELNLNLKNIDDSDNYFEDIKNSKENEKIIKSELNDIDTNINKKINNSNVDSYNNMNDHSNRELENNSSICELNENNTNENKIILNGKNNKNENIKNRNNKKINSKSSNQMVIEDKTLTEKSLVHLQEFTNDNIVEKLIRCPQNKYISLSCSEANKVALVIINLMETKNELENEIEEEKKKNEIICNKIKLDFDKQKSDIQAKNEKKELNVINILNELRKEIDEEKKFLEEEEKGYNLWDHVSIENQRTKEIRENIIKKLASFKK